MVGRTRPSKEALWRGCKLSSITEENGLLGKILREETDYRIIQLRWCKKLTGILAKHLPPLGTTIEDNPIALIHLWVDNQDFFLFEFDPESKIAYGLCCYRPGETSIEPISLQELVFTRGSIGQFLDLDEWWEPKRISECRKEWLRHHGVA